MASLRAQKKALRSSILASRKSLSASSIQSQSERIANAVVHSSEFTKSSSISCYLSMPDEVDTSGIVAEILRQGKKLFVPRINRTTGLMDMLRVYDVDDLGSLPSGMWGIREPDVERFSTGDQRENALEAQLDLILMPGVAFDRSFSRLGYGKGFYDKFLSAYKSRTTFDTTMPYLLGLALREHVLEQEQIPVGDYDWHVNGIASPAFIDDLLRSDLHQ